MTTTYTVRMKRIKPGNKVIYVDIPHCIQMESQWYRPMAYRDETENRRPVKDIDEEIGWEYIPLETEGYMLDKVMKE